jgi:hypothetical protein
MSRCGHSFTLLTALLLQFAELERRSQAAAEQAQTECVRAISDAAEALGQRLGASAAPSSAAEPSVGREKPHLAVERRSLRRHSYRWDTHDCPSECSKFNSASCAVPLTTPTRPHIQGVQPHPSIPRLRGNTTRGSEIVSAPRITLASSSGSGSSDGGDSAGDDKGGGPAWHRRLPSLQGCDHQALLRQQVLQNARGPPSRSISAAGSNSSTPRRRLEAAFAAAVVERGQRGAPSDEHGGGNGNRVKVKGRKETASIGRSPSVRGVDGLDPRFRSDVRALTMSQGDGCRGSSVRRTYTDLITVASSRRVADGVRAGHLLSGDSD